MEALQAVNVDKSPGDAFLKQADRLYRRHWQPTEPENCLQKALDAYYQALEHVPDSSEAFCGIAKTYLALGVYSRAARNAAMAIAQAERKGKHQARRIRVEAACMLGEIARHRGEWMQAAQAYGKAVQTGGWLSGPIWLGLLEARWKQFRHEASGFQRVSLLAQVFGALVPGIPAFITDWLSFSRLRLLPSTVLSLFYEEIEQTDAALDICLAMQARYPGLAEPGLRLGEMYRDKGDTDRAQYWFQKVLDRHPACVEALSGLAGLMEREENYPAMARLYELIISLKPTDSHAWCQLANAAYYGGNYRDALKAYETAFHLGTDRRWQASVAQGMGNLHADYLQNLPAAIACYESAKALNPSDLENYLQLGLLYFQQGNYGNAETVYRQALRIAPKHSRIYSNLGYLRWMADDLDEAMAHYQTAIALDAEYEIPLNNLGVIHLDMLGDFQQARMLFERAIAVNPHYALAWYNLGRAYSLMDNRPEAARHFRRARELNGGSRELDNDELTARINNLFDTCELEHRD